MRPRRRTPDPRVRPEAVPALRTETADQVGLGHLADRGRERTALFGIGVKPAVNSLVLREGFKAVPVVKREGITGPHKAAIAGAVRLAGRRRLARSIHVSATDFRIEPGNRARSKELQA